MMRSSLPATIYAFGIGFFGIAALVVLTDWNALGTHFVPLAFFAVLSFVLKRTGFHVAPDVTHSLVGIIDLAASLIFGPVPGAWVAAVSGFLYLLLNAARREKHTLRDLAEMPVFNAGLKIGMTYASIHLYLLFGGTFAPRELTPELILPVLVASLAWFGVDHIGWGILEFLRGGQQALANFVRAIIFYSVLIELLPLPFAIAIAVLYSSHDTELFLMISAALVGTAIIIQRFADTSQHLERRSSDLTVLNEFGQAVAHAGFDSEQVIQLLYEHARRIVATDLYRVELRDQIHDSRILLALEATRTATQHPYETQETTPVFDYFSTHRNPIRAMDLDKAFVYPLDATGPAISMRDRVRLDELIPRSALIVPMLAGEELIGVLSLFSHHAYTFYAIHARNLASMCAQAAVAIQNARLYAIERKRATQLTMVSEVSRQVAEFLDLDDLLQSVVTRIRERFGYTHVHIFTVDGDLGFASFRASTHPRGKEWRERGLGYRVGAEGIVGWVAAMGEPVIVNDVSREARFAPYPDQELDDTRSEAVVPLSIGNRVIGVLDVTSNELNTFNDDDLFILKTLAAQVAIALEDARLYNSQREEAYYLNVLLQVAENLSATRDLNEALETVVRITPLLVGVVRCVVFLYDADERVFVPAKSYGLSRELQDEFLKLRFRTDDGLVFDKLVREQTPLMLEDAAGSNLIQQKYLETFDIRSLFIAPLMTRGELVGAMLVDQGARSTRLSKHEIEVVMSIANQAAVAIESARLVNEAEGKKRLEYELGLARQIQKSFLPDECPVIPGYQVCSLWLTAREVSGDFFDFVALNSGRFAIIIADVSDKGMAAAMFMALSRTILRTMTIGKATTREAVERANDVILADSRSEMFVTVFHSILDPVHHRLTYVNAGHNPPFIYHAATGELTTLKGHGMALGVQPNITLEEHEVEIGLGDILLLYTDGVTDAINAQEEEFGAERLADLVAANVHQTASGLIDEISRAVNEFAGEGVHFDDLTMIALKRVM